MGAGGRGRAAGADLPDVRAGAPGLGRRARSLLRMRRNTPVGDPGRGGVPGMRSHGTLGRLAQLAERRPYKAKVGGSRPSAPTESAGRHLAIHETTPGEGVSSRHVHEPDDAEAMGAPRQQEPVRDDSEAVDGAHWLHGDRYRRGLVADGCALRLGPADEPKHANHRVDLGSGARLGRSPRVVDQRHDLQLAPRKELDDVDRDERWLIVLGVVVLAMLLAYLRGSRRRRDASSRAVGSPG